MTRRQITRRRPHGPGCRHCPRVRALGREFAGWRESWELAREEACHGYRTEEHGWTPGHPAPTFKRYLQAMTGAGWPMSGAA